MVALVPIHADCPSVKYAYAIKVTKRGCLILLHCHTSDTVGVAYAVISG